MKISPALVLFVLAPAIGELLSGSSPPAEFLHPVSFLLLASLYGSGAVIVRELKIRWKKGYVSMVMLGAAYGFLEEGLMVKSFFDPGWMDLGVLGVYGRWGGVNWVWAEWLTIYHAIFSISIPIVLVELAYPERRNEPWIGHKTLYGLITLLGVVTVFGFLFLTEYRPPGYLYVLTIGVVVFFTLLAWKTPFHVGKQGNIRVLTPTKFGVIGFFTALSLFLYFGGGPALFGQFPLLMIGGIGIILVLFSFLKRYQWSEKTLNHKFALVAGAIAFFIVLTPLQELDKTRPDNTQGMVIVGVIALILLLHLRKALTAYLAEVNALVSRQGRPPTCSRCGIQVPVEARFCQECGLQLYRTSQLP